MWVVSKMQSDMMGGWKSNTAQVLIRHVLPIATEKHKLISNLPFIPAHSSRDMLIMNTKRDREGDRAILTVSKEPVKQFELPRQSLEEQDEILFSKKKKEKKKTKQK